MVKERKSECMGEMTAGSWPDPSSGPFTDVLGGPSMMVVSFGEEGFSGCGMACGRSGRSVGA